jgi:hypothetical protein
MVCPEQRVLAPVIAAGVPLTVTTVVAGAPQPSLKLMVTVPCVLPVTWPDTSTLAIEVEALYHVPDALSVRVIVLPVQTTPLPPIEGTVPVTVTVTVAAAPQLLL